MRHRNGENVVYERSGILTTESKRQEGCSLTGSPNCWIKPSATCAYDLFEGQLSKKEAMIDANCHELSEYTFMSVMKVTKKGTTHGINNPQKSMDETNLAREQRTYHMQRFFLCSNYITLRTKLIFNSRSPGGGQIRPPPFFQNNEPLKLSTYLLPH